MLAAVRDSLNCALPASTDIHRKLRKQSPFGVRLRFCKLRAYLYPVPAQLGIDTAVSGEAMFGFGDAIHAFSRVSGMFEGLAHCWSMSGVDRSTRLHGGTEEW